MNLASDTAAQVNDRLSLASHFDSLMGVWLDAAATKFRYGCWEPISQAARNLELAMTTLAEVIEQARNQVP